MNEFIELTLKSDGSKCSIRKIDITWFRSGKVVVVNFGNSIRFDVEETYDEIVKLISPAKTPSTQIGFIQKEN